MKSHCVSALLVAIVAVNLTELSLFAGEPPRSPSEAKPIFVPFDFYPRHREELGLNDEQVREMQRLSDQMRESALSLEGERRERTKALQDLMAQDSVDPKKAMELFQAVLQTENEIKALQFRNGIAMRNLLTPAQVAKLLPLAMKDKTAGIAATSGVLDEKLQQLRAEIRKRSTGGEPSREVVAKVEQIEQLARQGHVTEARTQIDEMLRDLRSGATSTSSDGGKSVTPSNESQGRKGKAE